MSIEATPKEYIASLVERARKAQLIAETFTQERVDELVTAIVWDIVQEGTSRQIAQMAVDETKMGNFDGKYAKLQGKLRGVLRDMKGEKTVGVVERNEKMGIIKIAKPAGVVGAILPMTNPEATPVMVAMMAVKTRSAAILHPHRRAQKTNNYIVSLIRATLKKYGAPEDLVIGIEGSSRDTILELMKQVDLIVASGGKSLSNAAYSSGTPAYGVGQGNAPSVVDETADLKDAANKIMRSKTFDFATSCSTENSLVIQESVYDEMIQCLKNEGGYLVNADEKAKLQAGMWIDGSLNGDIVGQPLEVIAKIAGLTIPADRKFFMVEETGIGPDYPFSGEKISMVVTIYKYGEFQEAIDIVKTITDYQGRGHSCGIHSFDEERIMKYALAINVGRLMIRQPQCLSNSGSWTNGMPMTLIQGSGTWGRNISSDNFNFRKLLNYTLVAAPIESTQPTDEELFGDIMLQNR